MTKKFFYPIVLFVPFAIVSILIGWSIWPHPTPLLAQAGNLVPLSNITRVAAGGYHTCALTTGGGVKCWGRNNSGQLGDGTNIDQNTPVDVSGLSNGVTTIAASGDHSCALMTSGGVKCWGNNHYGQLGDSTTTAKSTLVDVNGLSSGVVAIAAGSGYTCALTTVGGIKCWGSNSAGQLGDGTTAYTKTAPVDVSGLSSGVVAIAAGESHTCALTTGGGVKCWGDNYSGELGDGTTDGKNTPVDVSGLSSGVTAITTGGDYNGEHTCALTTGGGVKCWGYNDYGQLGDGTGVDQHIPVDVNGLSSGIVAITARRNHTCALTTSGSVKCWGENDAGELGDNTLVSKNTPIDVIGLNSGITAIVTGSYHTCALTTGKNVKCWGENYSGQLGIGVAGGDKHIPVDVYGLTSGVATMALGYRHTCAVTTSASAKCWGNNDYGQLGDNTSGFDRRIAVDVVGLSSGVAVLTAGGDHTCAATTNGITQCWGDNYFGELGDGTTENRHTPVDVIGLSTGVSALTAGKDYTCALTNSGGVKCWGANYGGELGDGTTSNKHTPVDVIGLSSGIAAISAGGYHTCALTMNGGVKCWGENVDGELGNGMTVFSQTTPVDVTSLSSGVIAITAGYAHTCALTTNGGVKCWGSNTGGQLGDGTTDNKSTPVDVAGLGSGVIAVAAGNSHTCALTTEGGVKCWGWNDDSQLGDGSIINKITPVDVSRLISGVVALFAGEFHTCVVTTGGGSKCWGNNNFGQLSDSSDLRTTPADVLVREESGTTTPTPSLTTTSTATNPPTSSPGVTPTPSAISSPTNTTTPTTTPLATNTPTATPVPTTVTVRVEGQVIDQNTQAGVPNVLMTLTGASKAVVQGSNLDWPASTHIAREQVYTTTTDLNGVYVFPAVKLGAYTLTGVKAGVVIQSSAPLVFSTDGTVQMPPLLVTPAKPTIYLPLVTR